MADMKEKIEDVSGKIKSGTSRVGESAREAMHEAGEKAKDAATGLVGAVKEKAREAGAGASELAGKAKDIAQEWASSVTTAAAHTKDKAQEMASCAVDKAGDLGQE